jgi:AcrR family transcriptional regulator
MTKPPPRRRDVARSRQAILDAAAELFAQHGFDGTSFGQICPAAGVSRGLPAYLFGNKRKLYRAVVDRGAGELRAQMTAALRSIPSDAGAEVILERFVNAYLDYLAANRTIVRLLQFEMLGSSDQSAIGIGGALFEEGLELLRGAFKRAKLRDVEARHTLLSIVALCFYPFMVKNVGFSVDPFSRAFVSARKRHIVGLLLREIGR